MIALISPNSRLGESWLGFPEVVHFRSLREVAPWSQVDVVIYDMQALRVGTSSAIIDEDRLMAEVEAAARANLDAHWIIIGGPSSANEAHHLAWRLGPILLHGFNGIYVLDEPERPFKAESKIKEWLADIERLDSIPISETTPRKLSPDEWRCIRRLLRGVEYAELQSFGQGQGGALTLLVHRVIASAEMPLQVIKLGDKSHIEREQEKYQDYVLDKLGGYRYPVPSRTSFWYAGDAGALIYSYVGGPKPLPLAVGVAAGDGRSVNAVGELFNEVLRPWLDMRLGMTTPIDTFVSIFLRDYSLPQALARWEATASPAGVVNPVPWLIDISARSIVLDMPIVIGHGDLHGFNVLLDSHGHPWVIDFYWTGEYCGIFDFAYLDLYLLLHRLSAADPNTIRCRDEDLERSERDSFGGANAIRPELTEIRRLAEARWGKVGLALFHLGRACLALRLLQYDSTDIARAKLIASLAGEEVRRLNPAWETSPPVEDLRL